MLENVVQVLHERCGIDPPASLVVGVSGGPDSLCLLHLLHALGLELTVAHLDHQLRPDSAADAAAVEAVATELHLPFVLQRVDVRALAESRKLSVEEGAREQRYAFLFEEARRRSAHAVAVGHTADDQVETVLMHLIRGGGLAGLSGMSHRTILAQFDASIPLVRPLLGIWRWETVEYCAAHSLVPRHDKTNDSLEYFRNRVRRELIPVLESYNPRVRQALWRTAEGLASDLTLVEEHVALAWCQLVVREGPRFVCFDSTLLAAQSVPLKRRLVLAGARHIQPRTELTFEGLDRAADFISEPSASRLDLGQGLRLIREGQNLYISLGDAGLPTQHWPQMESDSIEVDAGSPVLMPLADGWRFTLNYTVASGLSTEVIARDADAFRACLDADALAGPLVLRPPRAGDRFQPLGMQGHTQKLSDLFVNGKLPARARRRWPLLCCGDAIIWVPGFRPADPYRIKAETRRVACFALSRSK